MTVELFVFLGIVGFLWNRLAKLEHRLDDLERRIEQSQLRESRLRDSPRPDSPLRDSPRAAHPGPAEPATEAPPATIPMPRPAASAVLKESQRRELKELEPAIRPPTLDLPGTIRSDAQRRTETAARTDAEHSEPQYRQRQSGTSKPEFAPPPPSESAPLRWLREYFTGGNLVVRVGVIVLFFGVAFLLKYAAEHTHVPIEARLAGVALGAMVLLGVGWRLRHRRPGFALALQGGAVGLLYLCVFAAFRLYHLLPPTLAFTLLAVIGASSALLALSQNSQSLALLGSAGGFLAPVFASTGTGGHVTLFSYYALLDVAILAIAWFKAWQPLNLLAFVFTFGIGTLWGVTQYSPEKFASTEPFLVFFFLIFVTISVLFALRRAPQLTHYVDGTLVFGTPVAAMGLQLALIRDIPYGRAFSAVAAAAVYLGLAWFLYRTRRDTLRLLVESFVALGAALLTLAVPLTLDGHWTAATWALEGAAALWMGLRQRRWLTCAVGSLLQFAAGLAYLAHALDDRATQAIFNTRFLCALLISLGGLLSARALSRASMLRDRFGAAPGYVFLAWGLGWWLFAALSESGRFMPVEWQAGAALLIVAATAALAGWGAIRWSWTELRLPALLMLPWMLFAAILMAPLGHPFAHGGWLGWPVSAVVLLWNLRRHEEQLDEAVLPILHIGGLWLLSLLAAWECHWQVARWVPDSSVWADAAWAVAPAVVLAGLCTSTLMRRWPIRIHQDLYLGGGALGLTLLLMLWTLWINLHSDAGAAPLRYLPVLNPLDLPVGLVLFVVTGWLLRLWREPDLLDDAWRHALVVALPAVGFCWVNGILLRTVHHWVDVPYRLGDLLRSIEVQASLSIFWTLLALGSMLWATRKGVRVVWFIGASLMAVVVAKLFLVDLAGIGTIPRIVSFIGVGGLMLVIGYFSPLPPAAAKESP